MQHNIIKPFGAFLFYEKEVFCVAKRGRKKSIKTEDVMKEARRQLTTKEELEEYLNTYEDLPLLDELWETCVKSAKKNADDIANGDVLQGNRSINPCTLYFSRMSLPQYRKKINELKMSEDYDADDLSESASEAMELLDDSGEQSNEIILWIKMFPKLNERKYLMQRYANYYDNYEINDGADRTLLARILSLEIELFRINCDRAIGKSVDINMEEKLTKMLRDTMESMKWTKKQRSQMDDMAQNKFSVWLDRLVKEGKFVPERHEIQKDEIDYFLELQMSQIKKMDIE